MTYLDWLAQQDLETCTFKEAFQAGAASRDAEVQRLQMALADTEALELGTAERCDQLRAHINLLISAIKVVEIDSEEVLDFDECTAMCMPMDAYHGLVEAAEATTEQSLAEYRNKVIEQMIACYSPDDSAHDYFDKLNAMKEQP